MPVTRTAIKTFKRAKSKENIAETKSMVKAGLNSTVSPTEKKAPGSIHEILEQMQVSANNPDAKAGRLAADRWRSARQIYDDFCTETSFTALTRIHKATHLYKRICWLVLCLGMMTWLIIQCYWLFQKYYSYPVEVKIELKAVSKLDFPSISVCNLNPLKKKYMHHGPFEDLEDYFELDDTDSLYDDYWADVHEHFMDRRNASNRYMNSRISSFHLTHEAQSELLRSFRESDLIHETSCVVLLLPDKSGSEEDEPPGPPGPPEPTAPPGNSTSNDTDPTEALDLTSMIKDYMKNQNFNKWKALENDTEMEERFYQEMDDSHMAAMAYANVAVQMTPEDLEDFGHHKDDLILSCHYLGKACSPANFTHFTNFKYGNCYTFNAFDSGQPALSSNYAGPLMGLTLEFNIEQRDYIPALSPDAGVRILIHKRGTYPFPEDEGFSIPPGYMTSVGLDVKNYIRLPPPHADCGNSGVDVKNYYTDGFDVDYTKQSCLKSCFQNVIMDTCGCAFSFYYIPPGSNVCDFDGNFSNCMENNCDETLQACSEKCPTPCEETKFGYSLSMSKWPSEQYEDHLGAKLQKATSQFFEDDDRSDSEDTVAKLEVYFKELIYEKMEQQKAYESQNLISDIGGQLGLWLGLSAITIGELIEFIASICKLSSNKILGRKGDEAKTPITKVQPIV